jgi:hypothetical protein
MDCKFRTSVLNPKSDLLKAGVTIHADNEPLWARYINRSRSPLELCSPSV